MDASDNTATSDAASEQMVCICKQVSKQQLVDAIARYKLTQLHQVRCFTQANTGCGACYEDVKAILTHTANKESS